jgi:hypothetical protein
MLLGTGSGGFSKPPGSPFAVPSTAGSTESGVVAGNFNGDKYSDLAVALVEPGAVAAVDVLLGSPSGGLGTAPGSPIHVPSSYSIAAADLNGDGRQDLVTVGASDLSGSNGELSALLGDGSGGFSQAPASPWDLGATGVNAVGIALGDLNGDGRQDLVIADGGSVAVELNGELTASLGGTPNPTVTRRTVALGANAFEFMSGTHYRWDLGSDRFTVDTGTTPTTSTTFSKIGVAHVRVKVTDDAGKSVIASAAIDVVRRGGVGVSVDNGKYATNDPKLKLYLVWPANTGKARISADGGFGPSDRTRTVSVAPIVGWKAPSGSGRVARTVYVRFPDSTTPLQTYTDDIVLDTTQPTVQSATLLGKREDVFRVELRAAAPISGIADVQVSRVRHGGTTVVLVDPKRRGIVKLARVIGVKTASPPRWARVRSSAGNWSKWHRLG